jgi:hypothetical protein
MSRNVSRDSLSVAVEIGVIGELRGFRMSDGV